jgi:GxxExxY protein
MSDGKLRHENLTSVILGVFYEVYNELGHGFLESVYRRAMLIALRARGLRADDETPIDVWFRGENVGAFRADILVEDAIILELQAARAVDSAHEAKLLHYLRATDKEVGFLMNFGPKPTFKRFLFDNPRKRALPSFEKK